MSIKDTIFDYPVPNIIHEGKTFCFTGTFDLADRKTLSLAVESIGGYVSKSMTKKVNVLIVGMGGSDAWKFGDYGDKIQDALNLKAKGHDIIIISEEHWIAFVPSSIDFDTLKSETLVKKIDYSSYIPSKLNAGPLRLERASLLLKEIDRSFSEYIAFDFETTGLYFDDEIIEIGAVKFKNGVVVDTFSTLVKPSFSIPSFVTDLTGISDAMVSNEKPISHVLPDFLKFISNHVLLAHNLAFDEKFLLSNIQKSGLNEINNKGLCTLALSRRFLKDTENHKLDTVANYLQLETKPNHRAYEDSKVCGLVFQKIVDLMREKHSLRL